MVWEFFHSHGMYSGISLDKWASVSSTGGLEDRPDPGSVKMTMRDIKEGLRLAPDRLSGGPSVSYPAYLLLKRQSFVDIPY
jgi:hypothetical protein